MNDALDFGLQDAVVAAEIRLVTELIVVASRAPGELEQGVIDDALGLEPAARTIPAQRQAT